MRVSQVPGSTIEQRGTPKRWRDRLYVEWRQDWEGVLFPHRWNLIDFTVIWLSVELEWMIGYAGFNAALLGFHVQVAWFWESETVPLGEGDDAA